MFKNWTLELEVSAIPDRTFIPPSCGPHLSFQTGNDGNIEDEMTLEDRSSDATRGVRCAVDASVLHRLTHEGPGKQFFEFPEDRVAFSSRFDAGSMAHVARVSTNDYHVTIPEDASASGISTGYTTWFYFEVAVDSQPPVCPHPETDKPETKKEKPVGVKTRGMRELALTLTNMNNQRGLFSNGYTVMCCAMDASSSRTRGESADDVEQFFENERKWMRLPTPIDVQKYTYTAAKSTSGNNEDNDSAETCDVKASEQAPPAKSETKMKISFTHHMQFARERVRFAFCYPYSYAKVQRHLATIDAKHRLGSSEADSSIYYHRDVVTHSLGGLPIELLTVSSTDGLLDTHEPSIPSLYPACTGTQAARSRQFDLRKKRTVFITTRVHPGETPANFMLEGMLRLLLHPTDESAAALRRHFIFKIIPVLNPDGVCQGFYRTDMRGVNLNRVYERPQLTEEPAIFAAKALVMQTVESYGKEKASENVVYLDLHAHSNHRGCFVYGNFLAQDETTTAKSRDWTRQVQTQLFAKLSSLHSPFFDYAACSFDASNMTRRDARDNNNATTSRAGSSRVGLYRATSLTYVYTIECNYNEGRRRLEASTKLGSRSKLDSPALVSPDRIPRHAAPLGSRLFVKYAPAEWIDVGIGCIQALLDLFQFAPSRSSWPTPLSSSPYRTLDGVKKSILSDLKSSELLDKEQPSRVSMSQKAQTPKKSTLSTRHDQITAQRAVKTPLSPPIVSKY